MKDKNLTAFLKMSKLMLDDKSFFASSLQALVTTNNIYCVLHVSKIFCQKLLQNDITSIIKHGILSKSTRSKSTRLKKIFSLFINKFKIFFEFFLFYIYLLFTITNTPNPYPRPVSGSRVWPGGFWTRVDFERVPDLIV